MLHLHFFFYVFRYSGISIYSNKYSTKGLDSVLFFKGLTNVGLCAGGGISNLKLFLLFFKKYYLIFYFYCYK